MYFGWRRRYKFFNLIFNNTIQIHWTVYLRNFVSFQVGIDFFVQFFWVGLNTALLAGLVFGFDPISILLKRLNTSKTPIFKLLSAAISVWKCNGFFCWQFFLAAFLNSKNPLSYPGKNFCNFYTKDVFLLDKFWIWFWTDFFGLFSIYALFPRFSS